MMIESMLSWIQSGDTARIKLELRLAQNMANHRANLALAELFTGNVQLIKATGRHSSGA